MENTATNGKKPPIPSVADVIEQEVREGKITLTPLGRKLLDARRAIEESGIPLLSGEDLAREKRERRG